MLISLFKIVQHKVLQFCSNIRFDLLQKLGRIKSAKIEDGGNIGQKFLVFKEETIETIELQNVFEAFSEGSVNVRFPEVDVWKFNKALCFSDSDFVILPNNKAYWPKYHAYNYSKNIVKDSFLIRVENGVLYYRNPKHIRHVKCAFSLIGVYAHVWSHALSEHYIKLSVLGEIVAKSKERVTVLVPDYGDQQLKEIVYAQLKKHDVDIEVINKGEAVLAETLYHMERPAFFTDHEVAVVTGDNAQPKIVSDILKKQLVQPLVKDLEQKERIKLFLPRRGSYRAMTNNDEVEDYFKKQGYVFIEPHKISLEEKVRLFRSAEVIVGSFSSAFSNLIFCKPGTKVLIFSNYYRSFESWLVMHKQHFGMDMLWVTGYDDKTAVNPAHCNFTISLEKIKRAAKAHGIID